MDDKETQEEEGKSEENEESKSEEKTGTEKALITLDRADEIAERQKRENDRREALIERDEALAARKVVGGETEAGSESKPQYSEEEKASRARIKAVGDVKGSAWAKQYE